MLRSALNTIGSWLAPKPAASGLSAERKAEIQQRVINALQERYANLRATYDAARTSDDFSKYWSNSDSFDADSANSKSVRHTLIQRSRYEIGNNGYADGIAQTYANHLVGVGPSLRMQTASDGFNRLVETTWFYWSKATGLRRKLWCMAHAKHSDGETFGVMRRNPGLKNTLPLDLTLYEAEQVQTPFIPFATPGHIDGIVFDEFGNPTFYEILKQHPGTTNAINLSLIPETIPASRVVHWFKLRRPGQHRAVPECSSTLNVGAAARRWREATLAAAETAADFTIFLKTQFQPDSEEMQYASDFSQQEITKRMMTALPVGYDPFQMKAEHPTANYEMFHKTLINEIARPKSMPYNVAACDSSSYNYSSGRLDHQTYYTHLDVEREDCNDLVLDPLFDAWFELAVVKFGWLGGNPDAIGPGARAHLWDWPKHRVADVEAEANANQTSLTSGQVFLHQLYSDAGRDLADDIATAAQEFGVGEDEIRRRLLDITLPDPAKQQPAPQRPANSAADKALAALLERGLPVNGHVNGHKVN